jgi:hypothetical protein
MGNGKGKKMGKGKWRQASKCERAHTYAHQLGRIASASGIAIAIAIATITNAASLQQRPPRRMPEVMIASHEQPNQEPIHQTSDRTQTTTCTTTVTTATSVGVAIAVDVVVVVLVIASREQPLRLLPGVELAPQPMPSMKRDTRRSPPLPLP